MTAIESFMGEFDFNPPAPEPKIVELEREEGIILSQSYRDFLRKGNGGEGPIGEFGYACLWKVEEISRLNREYRVPEYLNGYLLIGSDGGGEAFAIKRSTGAFYQVPFIGMCHNNCTSMGLTFLEFIQKLSGRS